MKRLLFFFALLFMGAMTAFAQVPVNEQLTYQTVVRNAQNQLVFSQDNVSVTVEVCNADGSVVRYSETHSGLSTNANGLLTLMLGSGTVNFGTWDDINWSDASIKTTVSYNPGDGTVTINSAPAPVTAVPYAIQAGNAIPQVQSNWTEGDDTQASFIQNKPTLATVATSGDYNDLTNKPTIPDAQENADWNATSGVSQILNKPDLTVYATQSGNNTFAGDNSFTGTNTVHSGFNIHSTDASNCNNVVVNACDLLAVFDSLNRRFNSVYDSLQRLNDELTALKNSVPPTATAPSFQNVGSNSMTIKANNTSTGASITSYKYCYSTNENMSGAICQTASTPTLNVTGLTANTTYYATVEATNLAGSTTSETANVRTPAHAPTVANVSGPVAKPAGFKVEVTGIDPKEKTDNTTVQVCYVAKGSGECPDKESANYADCKTVDATGVTDTTISVTGLTPSTAYCAIVKVSNGDSTTIDGPYTVTTGADVTLSVAQTGGGIISLCSNPSVNVTYTATPSDGGSYTYNWSGTTASTSDNTATYSYTSASTYNVTVTATHTTEGYTLTATTSTTVSSGGTAPTIAFCVDDENYRVSVKTASNVSSVKWGDGKSTTGLITTSTEPHEYPNSPATYNVIAYSESGCSVEKKVSLGGHNPYSCAVSTPHTDGSTYTSTTGGLETVNDEGKVVSVQDQDGHTYAVTQIGDYCLIRTNLRTTKYRSETGTSNEIDDGGSTTSYDKPYYYKPTSSSSWSASYEVTRDMYNDSIFGYYYNWAAAAREDICPEGWHVPDTAEWRRIVDVAGASTTDGAVKLAGGCLWYSTSGSGTYPNNYGHPERDKWGFSAVPAGYCYGTSFGIAGYNAYFWSATPRNSSGAWGRGLYFGSQNVLEYYYNEGSGFSVRCLRDY